MSLGGGVGESTNGGSGLSIRGPYDATTNTPPLWDGTGRKGLCYKVSVAGTRDFSLHPELANNIIELAVGDLVFYSFTKWAKLDQTFVDNLIGYAREIDLYAAIQALLGGVEESGNTFKKLFDLIGAGGSGGSNLETVNDISARDALALTLTETDNGKQVFVTDATADTSVTTGWAIYQFIFSTVSWRKISEQESIDIILSSFADKTLSNLTNIQTARQNIGLDYESTTETFDSTITWDFIQGGVQKTIDALETEATGDFTLALSNAGITGLFLVKKTTANPVYITLAGAGLTHKDSNVEITTLVLPGDINEEYFLTFYKFGSRIYWITRDGQIVQTLSASTSDIPSVGLLKSELDLRFKMGGNAFGAASSIGNTDNFDFTLLRNNTEALALLSAGARIKGNVLLGASTGTAHSNQQSAGSVAKFTRTITGARTLDITDNIILANGTFNVTLPTAVNISGREYKIKNIGAGVITVVCNGAQTIDGVATKTLNAGEKVIVLSDNVNWNSF